MIKINATMGIEPLRDVVGRAIFEEPGKGLDWYGLSEERREPWRQDADRIIDAIADYEPALAEWRKSLKR